MMHGHEKSDSAIVAMKPANNAGRPAAEQVERRAGTEGKAGQQSTRRAQDRESVSQALDRIRQAARQRPKERFTAPGRSGSWVTPSLNRAARGHVKRPSASPPSAPSDRGLSRYRKRAESLNHTRLRAVKRHTKKTDGW